MATPVIMPRQGQTVESCVITRWHKNVGDDVAAGDALFSYETDKAAFDEASPVDGIMLARFFEEDDDVPVLTNVCVIGQQGEDASAFSPDGSIETAKPQETESPSAQATSSEEKKTLLESPAGNASAGTAGTQDRIDDKRVRISPRARSLAQRAKIDYTPATPSGPGGRIIERDVIDLIASRSAANPLQGGFEERAPGISASKGARTGATAYEEVKLTNMRKRISEAMYTSLSTTAQLTIHSSFDATYILAYRKRLKKAKDDKLQEINITHIVLYAVAKTLLNHRSLNAHLLDDRMLLFNHVNLGIAVDTERGLMVPTIFEADQRSLAEISAEARRLTEACRTGAINPDDLQGGTFTVTNLGTLGVEYFTPVLNPPQTAILGVNAIVQRVKETDKDISCFPAIGLSLTFDHRAVDGAPAARFLQDLSRNLESFAALLAQ